MRALRQSFVYTNSTKKVSVDPSVQQPTTNFTYVYSQHIHLKKYVSLHINHRLASLIAGTII
jgi:hypothetical protein